MLLNAATDMGAGSVAVMLLEVMEAPLVLCSVVLARCDVPATGVERDCDVRESCSIESHTANSSAVKESRSDI
jgi:hypothetical protein